ncbi:MAG TPA: ABC transporter substrate-binding protein, partial [Acidimicrobiales bacterium]|nr:ABC transporter substrate-binding protein [Acidimicrobiales bacterium]
MSRSRKGLVAVAAAVTLLAAACSSSSKSSAGTAGATSGSSGSSGGKTITVGVLTDLTGAGSNTAASFPLGIKAGVALAAQQGYNIKVVQADSATSPTGVLTAAQRLVEEDHVFAVLLTSVVGFGAAPYLASKGIPVIGCACDGTEWISDRNMFSVIGTQDYNKVQTTYGEFFKAHGVTSIGTVGYGIEPSSADTAKNAALSAQHEGIKVGYINTNFPLGSTNVEPIALAMKNNGVNGLATGILTASTFAIIEALKQQGVDLKAALPPTGYGGDLLTGGPGAEQAAQGIYFLSGYEPVEMNTPATQRFQNAMKTYAGVSGDPTFAEYIGYVTVDALVQGLKAAGKNPTQASLINAMLGITSYNAAGLYGDHTIGWAMDQRGLYEGAGNCFYITQFQGTTFHLVPNEDPL